MSFLFNMRFHLHVYIQQSPSHIWVFAFMGLQGFSVGHEEVLLALTYKFFHSPQYVQTYEFGFYYVILITFFCHLYLIWDFTYTCVSNNLSLIFEYLPLCGLQGFSVGHEKVLPALISFFIYQYVIYWPLVCHPWKPYVNLACSSTKIGPHFHVHRNLGYTSFFFFPPNNISNTILLGLSP